MNNNYLYESVLTDNDKNTLKKNNIEIINNFKANDNKNTIVDISSNKFKSDEAFIRFIQKMLQDTEKEFGNRIIYIPIKHLDSNNIEGDRGYIGAIIRYMKISSVDFRNRFPNTVFIFYNEIKETLPIYTDKYKSTEYNQFKNLIITLIKNNESTKPNINTVASQQPVILRKPTEDDKSPVKDVKVEKNIDIEKIEVKNKKEDELVANIVNNVEDSDNEEEAYENIENDDNFKAALMDLDAEDDGKPKFNATRQNRMNTLSKELLKKEVHGKTIEEIISNDKDDEIESTSMKINSINDEWKDVKFINFQKKYDINFDILNILKSLHDMSYPIDIINIEVEDTSTNMDYIYTYRVETEDGFGKRSTLTFDIPKFKNNRFMRLRGNEKIMSGQLLLLPCIKTDEDTVQCVSNYNKIFIRRKGALSKSYPSSDRFLKAIKKLGNQDKNIKVVVGDNTTICSKYELPVDYIDICSQITRIETSDKIYYFNQDEYYSKYKADSSLGIPYCVNRNTGEVYYVKMDDDGNILMNNAPMLLSDIISNEISNASDKFREILSATKVSNTLNYSEASILSNKIPLIVILGYTLGSLDAIAHRMKIDLDEDDKKFSNPSRIKFADTTLYYQTTYPASMLFNGLSACNTEMYNLKDMSSRSTWLDFLDSFGGRILSDGLDNFADLFLDPITKEVCKHVGIPSDYVGMLLYANSLLSNNKYNRHTDISGNRYRTNELIAGYFYKAISRAYVEYKAQVKRGRKVGISMKRSAVIDGIFEDPMTSDLSILNPLLEIEAANAVSFKGLSGMNSDRSYSLDKRTYDDSMNNKLALSTGFAANVGINRQTTIDMDITGKRGYIKDSKNDDKSVTKSLSMTEAVTPFGTTHDDPFRSAMTFIQTSKHSMRVGKSMPLLVTNGADEAMPYISSDTFAYKAKENGKVIELTNDYMVVAYDKAVITDDNKSYLNECIDLKNEVKKNSDGGFFITLKLDTDLKVGDIFKKGDIIAYDRSSFSDKVGEDDNLAYNVGVLAKVAIMNTDEGFEDSTSVSTWLSEAMATDVVVEKETDVSKNANIYQLVKIGDAVQEGDPLITMQNSFDEKDANMLLKNITDPSFVSDLGRVRVKSKYTGVIQDIKIYRTCDIEEMSDSLKKIVTEYEDKIKAQKKLYEKFKAPGANLLDPDYKMEATGKMKNNQDGVKIVFYIKYNDKLSVGDKVVAQSANKGVIKNIFPKGYEPFSEFRPDESIHALFAARSFNARMVTSVWVSGAINKCMIELDRAVKDIMGIDADTKLEDMC